MSIDKNSVQAAGSKPAPKKDRIYGSKKNRPGSAAGGKKIVFSEKTENALRNKVKEHNEKAPKGRKATLSMLKAVYRRGSGAFSSSHRPGKTRDQWAMARVNAFLRLLKSGKPSNPNYKQDNDLLPSAHPKSSRGKTASAVTATGLVPEERDLAEALVEIADKYGKFNEDSTGIWAGYVPAEENDIVKIGVTCANCVLYRGGSECAIIDFEVEPNARCRFAVIPDTVFKPKNVDVQRAEDEAYVESQLNVEILDEKEYESPEHAVVSLVEYSGIGYEALPAFKAAWLRAVKDEESPFERVKELAISLYESKDADLLPRKA